VLDNWRSAVSNQVGSANVLSFLTDENFRAPILKGLRRQLPLLDIVRAQDAGLAGADDPAVLEWAAANRRVLLTHDIQTIPGFAYERVKTGGFVAGIVVVQFSLRPGRAIDDIRVIAECTDPSELEGKVWFVPL
jgi:hypothetical protein